MSYKVIVVDDKPLIVQALVQTIDWEGLGLTVEGYAEDGLEAKRLVDLVKPELLITDIKMPGLDGLELTEYVKKILPNTQIIMITGYQEFEYARRALTLGVSDLVLKPIKNNIMEEKIQKAVASLKKAEVWSQTVQSSRKALREQFLHEILKERIPAEPEFSEKVRELGFYKKDYYLILSRVRSGVDSVEKAVRKEVLLWIESRKEANGWEPFEWITGKNQVIIVFEKEKRSARARKVGLRQGLLALNEEIRRGCGAACCFVVSRTSTDLKNFPVCYREAVEMMESSYFTAEQTLLFSDSCSSTAITEDSNFFMNLDQICKSMEQLETGDLEKKTEELLDDIFRETAGDEFRVKCLLSEICLTFIRRFELKENTNELLETISRLTGKTSCRNFLGQFFIRARKNMERGQEESNPLIAEAMSYIREHYRENISLTDLAEHLTMNASYLSRLFKKETGKNFTEILTEYRISRAKYLLSQPGSRVVEVCEEVGYSDYTYFYQVFKKMEHISPSEYKKKSKKN